MNVLERVRAVLAGARAYRFEGEQENHADLLRERRVSLSMMEAADPNDADQVRMASEIEHDAENRLAVLVAKPRLTLAEKRERDAIQAAIQGRRQGFGDAPPVLEARTEPTRLARSLGPLAASPVLAILTSPITWVVVGIGAFGIQTARLNNAKGDLQDVRADLAMSERNAADLANTNERLLAEVNNANRDASVSAANWQAERDRRVRAEAERRRIQNEIAQARIGGPVSYGFDGVRNDGAPTPGAPGGDVTGGDPG